MNANGSHPNLIELTDDNFESEVVSSSQPVLVDFWAPWCAPCRAVAPTMETLAEDFAGKAKVGKINVDEHQAVAGALHIRSIPTVALFKDNKVVDIRVGALSRQEYTDMLNLALEQGN